MAKKYGKSAGIDWWKEGQPATKKLFCADTHKPLILPGGLKIYGGSCGYPRVKDADVYIGFDRGMNFHAKMPWEGGHNVLYPINDGHAPKNVGNFTKLIEWTIEQLEAGQQVHAGCIGGHGRTGTFLAALVALMGDEKHAVEYVRKGYCSKVVESNAQMEFLNKNFGIAMAPISRPAYKQKSKKGSNVVPLEPKTHKVEYLPLDKGATVSSDPLPNPLCVWGGEVFDDGD